MLRSGMPMQVVVPSVSRAAVLQGRAGTILVDPSGAGRDMPTVELGASAAIPCPAGGGSGADCPVIGGDGAGPLPVAPEPGTAPPWARANPTGRITASRPRIIALGPKIIMGSLPGFGLNRHWERLVPAIFEPALDFRGVRLRPVA